MSNMKSSNATANPNASTTSTTYRMQQISADYYVDMTQTIGNRPVITPRHYEYEIPKILTTSIQNTKFDATCKTPYWKKNCI